MHLPRRDKSRLYLRLSIMNIVIIGVTGFVGSHVLEEALGRGHRVTALVREGSKASREHPNLSFKRGDALQTEALAGLLPGHEAVLSAYNPGWQHPNLYEEFLAGARSIQAAVKEAGIRR